LNARCHFDHRRVPESVQALAQWTSHSQIECALALSIASSEAGDWRVCTLTWLYGRDDRDTEKIAFRLAIAAESAARIARIRTREDIVEAAVLDAMTLVRRDRRTPSARERSLQLRISNRSFLVLRDQAERSLRRALAAAMQAYIQACGYTFKPEHSQETGHGKVVTFPRAA
jgi:hypothetical protein